MDQQFASDQQQFNDQVGIAFDAQESTKAEVAGVEQNLLASTEAGFSAPPIPSLGNIPINIAQPASVQQSNADVELLNARQATASGSLPYFALGQPASPGSIVGVNSNSNGVGENVEPYSFTRALAEEVSKPDDYIGAGITSTYNGINRIAVNTAQNITLESLTALNGTAPPIFSTTASVVNAGPSYSFLADDVVPTSFITASEGGSALAASSDATALVTRESVTTVSTTGLKETSGVLKAFGQGAELLSNPAAGGALIVALNSTSYAKDFGSPAEIAVAASYDFAFGTGIAVVSDAVGFATGAIFTAPGISAPVAPTAAIGAAGLTNLGLSVLYGTVRVPLIKALSEGNVDSPDPAI